MAKIIKPNGVRQIAVSDYDRDRAPAFDDIVDDSAADPHAILANARAEAEQKVREAYEEGLRRGHAAGRQQFDETVGQAAETLLAVCEKMLDSHNAFLDSLQPQLVRLAVSLAERILEREVELDPTVVATTARAALKRILDAERVVLRVNPDDIAILRERRADILAEFERIQSLEFNPDPTIPTGGCVAVTDTLELDARLSEQLATMMKHMLAQTHEPSEETV